MKSVSSTCRKCLLILGMGLLPMTSAFAAPTFVVTSASGTLGGHVTVNVVAQSVSDLYDYQFDLNYDPTKIQFVSDTEGPFLKTAGSTFFFGGIPSAGSVQFVFDTLVGPGPGASGTGVLASFDFLDIGRGASTLSLANVIVQNTAGANIAVGLGTGQVTVPEPGTVGLLALALMGCVVSMRRKGSAQA